jgi:HIRAN domain
MAKEITLSVVGIQYRVTLPTRQEMNGLTPFKVRLEREPENQHDENAIKVVIDDKTMKRNGMHIGYLSRQVAATWADALDEGILEIEEAWLTRMPDEGPADMWLKFSKPLRKSLQISNTP